MTTDIKPNFVDFGKLVNRSTPLFQAFQAYNRIEPTDQFSVYWNVFTPTCSKHYLASLPVAVSSVPYRVNQEQESAQDALKALESAFCGSTQDVGLQAINDSTGTYAGINQASVTTWSGAELSAISSSIHGQATSILTTLMERGVDTSSLCIFAHPTAIRKFATSTAASLSLANKQFLFYGIPIVPVDSLPAGDLHFLDMSDAKIEIFHGPTAIDGENVVSVAGRLVLTNRSRHGKITNIDCNSAY